MNQLKDNLEIMRSRYVNALSGLKGIIPEAVLVNGELGVHHSGLTITLEEALHGPDGTWPLFDVLLSKRVREEMTLKFRHRARVVSMPDGSHHAKIWQAEIDAPFEGLAISECALLFVERRKAWFRLHDVRAQALLNRLNPEPRTGETVFQDLATVIQVLHDGLKCLKETLPEKHALIDQVWAVNRSDTLKYLSHPAVIELNFLLYSVALEVPQNVFTVWHRACLYAPETGREYASHFALESALKARL